MSITVTMKPESLSNVITTIINHRSAQAGIQHLHLQVCPTDLKPNGLSSKLDKTGHCSLNPKCNTWKFMTRLKAASGPIHKNVEDEEGEQEEKLHVPYYKPRCNSCLGDDNE